MRGQSTEANTVNSLVMCNDGSEERIWLTFGRQTLTGMDKLIIVKGVLVCLCVCKLM